MIYCFIGTKAQLIKMAPIMRELSQRDLPYKYIDSGQHAGITRELRRVFELPEPDLCLRNSGDDITSTKTAALWYFRLLWKSQRNRAWLRREVFPEDGVCLIHGDTLSTLLGLQMARSAGLRVAHVEAGLRSFHWFDPFPEELIRIICMKRSNLLFAPSQQAEANLRTMALKGQVLRIEGNTVADSLEWIRSRGTNTQVCPSHPYALATCHRLETISNHQRLRQVVELLNRISETMPVVFVVHGPTRSALQRQGFLERLSSTILVRDLMDYSDFIALLVGAEAVLSDGGSIQEECAYLDKPCLILRNQTERPDGLDQTAVLWRFDDEVAAAFLRGIGNRPPARETTLPRPSAHIVEHLATWD